MKLEQNYTLLRKGSGKENERNIMLSIHLLVLFFFFFLFGHDIGWVFAYRLSSPSSWHGAKLNIQQWGRIPSASTPFPSYRRRMSSNDDEDLGGGPKPDDQYEMNPFDAYPQSASDEEVLDMMREQNQISNDLWQSTFIRDNQKGEWIGSYEIFVPKDDDLSSDLSLGVVGRGNTKSVLGCKKEYTKDEELEMGGVQIECIEEISENKESEKFKSSGCGVFLEVVRGVTVSTDFRLTKGNQAIGGSYTLVRASPDNPQEYYTEIAIRDGNLRVRCKYLYHCEDDVNSISDSDDAEFKFKGMMLIREHLQGTSPVDLKFLLREDLGYKIYDPQNFGNPNYKEFAFPGQITCFFPTVVKYKEKGTLCIQWEGPGLRYQSDRKFETLAGGAIKTFEVTEIAKANADINYYS